MSGRGAAGIAWSRSAMRGLIAPRLRRLLARLRRRRRLAHLAHVTRRGSAEQRVLNLALQGGGAHGAFTWGVLDRLLEDERISFEGISATSAGAANATVLSYG